MKQLLNTLFVMTEDAYLALENDNVVIYQNDQTLAKVPLRSIQTESRGVRTIVYQPKKKMLKMIFHTTHI